MKQSQNLKVIKQILDALICVFSNRYSIAVFNLEKIEKLNNFEIFNLVNRF